MGTMSAMSRSLSVSPAAMWGSPFFLLPTVKLRHYLPCSDMTPKIAQLRNPLVGVRIPINLIAELDTLAKRRARLKIAFST